MAKKALRGRAGVSFGDSIADKETERQRLIGMVFDALRVPLLILDEQLCILTVNHAFSERFDLADKKSIPGQMFYRFGNGLWDKAGLRQSLEKVIAEGKDMEEFEMEGEFPGLGRRILLIRAHGIPDKNNKTILVSIFDVTEQRVRRAEIEQLIDQKALLIKEMRHRIGNNLQSIANILLVKAEVVGSAESREHLKDAYERIMAIAEIQKQLDPDRIASGEEIEIGEYLKSLIERLSRSMIGGKKQIAIAVKGHSDNVPAATAISMGLVTTELVINALKHAFPEDRTGHIIILHEKTKDGWLLSVHDDGIGKSEKLTKNASPGLGASIIGALAKQLHAVIRTEVSATGTNVTLVSGAHA